MTISLASGVAFVIIVMAIVLGVVGKCSVINGVVITVGFLAIGASGALAYFSLSGEVDWVITGSVIAGSFAACVLLAIAAAFCNRFVYFFEFRHDKLDTII